MKRTYLILCQTTFLYHQILAKKSFYSQLHPNFKEAVNWINNQQEVDEFSKMLDKFISDIKVKYQSANDATQNQIYISSNLPIEKSKKHHGCSGWNTSNKRKR